MNPITKYGPMPPGVVTMLARTLGMTQFMVLDLGKIDRRYEGFVQGGGKCVWLKDGRRVEFNTVPGGGYTASTSKEPDPAYPGKQKR